MPPDRAHDADLEILAAGEAAEGKSELRLWLRMLSATNLISAEIRRRLRVAFSVTLPQFDLMAQLAREPEGLRLGVLSKRMMVTNGNVTGLIDRLESEGLVERGSAAGDGACHGRALDRKGDGAVRAHGPSARDLGEGAAIRGGGGQCTDAVSIAWRREAVRRGPYRQGCGLNDHTRVVMVRRCSRSRSGWRPA